MSQRFDYYFNGEHIHHSNLSTDFAANNSVLIPEIMQKIRDNLTVLRRNRWTTQIFFEGVFLEEVEHWHPHTPHKDLLKNNPALLSLYAQFPSRFTFVKKEEVQTYKREYEVWSEGYSATGEQASAKFEGKSKPVFSFTEACHQLLSNNHFFDPDRLTVWGCRLFDNEMEARKAFG